MKTQSHNTRKAKPLTRLTPNQTAPQDLHVESIADESNKSASKSPKTPQMEQPTSKTTQQVFTKRTFRWGIEEDKQLVDALDAFNRQLPAGVKRLKMEHLGRAMRKLFIEADAQNLLQKAHAELYGKGTTTN